MRLNKEQEQVIRYADGPLLVLAGAGSGKTLTITRKIAWLIEQGGLAPAQLFAVTFTNKAAREMRARVGRLLRRQGEAGVHISTFHALGLQILRRECKAAGLRPGFSVLDSSDSAALIQELLQAESGNDKGLAEKARWQISLWKNALIDPAREPPAPGDPVAATAARLYAGYAEHLHACNAVDFDDLILLPIRMFRRNPEVLERWRQRLRYLLVDEYQDTNRGQYELIRLLVGERGCLTVVGDDDQSIYAWRGANPENIEQLQKDYPALKVVKLEQNYRSSGRILKAANHLIGHNPHGIRKRLWSDRGYGDPLRVLQCADEEQEAERVVSDLQHRMFRHNRRYGDFAILYRGNHQSRIFERVLRERRVPYTLSGGSSFFDRTEIKDLIAYLRLLANFSDNGAFLRVVNTPRRHIGPATLEKLNRYAGEKGLDLIEAADHATLHRELTAVQATRLTRFTGWVRDMAARAQEEKPAEILRAVIADTDYEDWLQETGKDRKAAERRLQNVGELLDWVRRLQDSIGGDLAQVVAHMTLMGMLDKDEDEQESDKVSLMTLHAAKGLEFPHVYITGMEEGLLPHHASLDEAAIVEERRLAYVGITRAEESLTLSLAARRRRQGRAVDCRPSRFLEELPRDDLQWLGRNDPDPENRQRLADAYLDNLRGLLGGESG